MGSLEVDSERFQGHAWIRRVPDSWSAGPDPHEYGPVSGGAVLFIILFIGGSDRAGAPRIALASCFFKKNPRIVDDWSTRRHVTSMSTCSQTMNPRLPKILVCGIHIIHSSHSYLLRAPFADAQTPAESFLQSLPANATLLQTGYIISTPTWVSMIRSHQLAPPNQSPQKLLGP